MEDTKIAIYQDSSGELKVNTKLYDKNLWLNQKQIWELYGRDKSTISDHIKKIYKDQELEEQSTSTDSRKLGISQSTWYISIKLIKPKHLDISYKEIKVLKK